MSNFINFIYVWDFYFNFKKKLRCYNIAKLYYQVGDNESAKKYVSNYLEIRDKSAGAHKLLGQALEGLGQKEAAFTQYKISLELEPKQDDLLLKGIIYFKYFIFILYFIEIIFFSMWAIVKYGYQYSKW